MLSAKMLCRPVHFFRIKRNCKPICAILIKRISYLTVENEILIFLIFNIISRMKRIVNKKSLANRNIIRKIFVQNYRYASCRNPFALLTCAYRAVKAPCVNSGVGSAASGYVISLVIDSLNSILKLFLNRYRVFLHLIAAVVCSEI